MICDLCLIKCLDPIRIDSDEGKQLEITALLQNYLSLHLPKNFSFNFICRDCWTYIQTFHEFCVRIENTHQKIFIQYKESIDVKEELEFPAENENINVEHEESDAESFKAEESRLEDDLNEADSIHTPERSDSPDDRDEYSAFDDTVVRNSKHSHTRCKLCYLECKKRCNLRTHFRKKHGKCLEPNCNATFSSLSGHDMHYTRVHRKTRCVHCNQKFGGKEIKLHIETNHTASAICHLCGKTFLHPAALRYHCETVHTRETKLQCDICKQWLKNRDTIRTHLRMHMEPPVSCDVCGKVVSNRKSLRSHMRIHDDTLLEKLKCIVCGKGFREKTRLKEHSYIHTGIVEGYECEFCGKKFRFSSSASLHRKKVHGALLEEMKRAQEESGIPPPNIHT